MFLRTLTTKYNLVYNQFPIRGTSRAEIASFGSYSLDSNIAKPLTWRDQPRSEFQKKKEKKRKYKSLYTQLI